MAKKISTSSLKKNVCIPHDADIACSICSPSENHKMIKKNPQCFWNCFGMVYFTCIKGQKFTQVKKRLFWKGL